MDKRNTAIRSLSGTSSFLNDTVQFTRFLFTRAIAFVSISQLFFGELQLESLPTSCITRKPKKPTLLFTVIVFTISCKTYNHRCQRKQMHRNYFRIITALCHLTAVYHTQLSCHKICNCIQCQILQLVTPPTTVVPQVRNALYFFLKVCTLYGNLFCDCTVHFSLVKFIHLFYMLHGLHFTVNIK